MFDKRRGFFQRLLKRIDKVDRAEVPEIISILLEERDLWEVLAENSPCKFTVHRDTELILDSSQGLYTAIKHLISEKSPKQTISCPAEFGQGDLTIKKVFYKNYQITYIYPPFSSNEQEQTAFKDSMEALEMLAAGISHEIKNPLTAIDIHTQILERSIQKGNIKVPPEIQDYIHLIKTENTRLLAVLDIFIGSMRKRRLTLTFCEIKDLILNLIKVFEGEFQEKEISLILDLDPIPKIFTSQEILQQIASDIIRNAIEALEDRETKQIVISLKENSTRDTICLSIEDSGQGIPANLRSRIFEPYYTTKKSGTGLGLTLVKKMVDELAGTISVEESRVGGAAFKINLPLSQGQKKLIYVNDNES
ncbi:MAG: two-component system sensor histidine kinase NtrB [Brevinema sp.]